MSRREPWSARLCGRSRPWGGTGPDRRGSTLGAPRHETSPARRGLRRGPLRQPLAPSVPSPHLWTHLAPRRRRVAALDPERPGTRPAQPDKARDEVRAGSRWPPRDRVNTCGLRSNLDEAQSRRGRPRAWPCCRSRPGGETGSVGPARFLECRDTGRAQRDRTRDEVHARIGCLLRDRVHTCGLPSPLDVAPSRRGPRSTGPSCRSPASRQRVGATGLRTLRRGGAAVRGRPAFELHGRIASHVAPGRPRPWPPNITHKSAAGTGTGTVRC
jgi:hypothetical protein